MALATAASAATHALTTAPPLRAVELYGRRVEAGALGEQLATWMKDQRWFNGKDSGIRSVAVDDVFRIARPGGVDEPAGYLLKTTVQHASDAAADATYYVPLAQGRSDVPVFNVGALQTADGALHLREGTELPDVVMGLRELRNGGRLVGAAGGELVGTGRASDGFIPAAQMEMLPSKIDSSNTVKLLQPKAAREMGEAAERETEVMKLVRMHAPDQRADATPYPGNSREAAMLAQNKGNAGVPDYAGGVEYRGADGTVHTITMTTRNVPNDGSALPEMESSATRVVEELLDGAPRAAAHEIERYARDGVGSQMRELAKLHARNAANPAGDVFSGVRPSHERRVAELAHLRARVDDVVERLAAANELGGRDAAVVKASLHRRIDQMRTGVDAGGDPDYIQIHGDFHPGQVLVNKGGRGHTLTDFEGKPNQSAAENAVPQHVYDDVAQMLGSIDYAGDAALLQALPEGVSPAVRARVEQGVGRWKDTAKRVALEEYHAQAGNAAFVPASADARQAALDEKLLKIMLHNAAYELGAQRGLVGTPVRQLVRIAGVD